MLCLFPESFFLSLSLWWKREITDFYFPLLDAQGGKRFGLLGKGLTRWLGLRIWIHSQDLILKPSLYDIPLVLLAKIGDRRELLYTCPYTLLAVPLRLQP